MKLYEVRRFNSENEKWAVEYVKEYTKEAYTKKYRYTPEVLKLDDGRTKYTLCIKAKQVATACKYLMTYFGEEIQNLPAIVADILANDPKATAHTKYIVEGNGYTCYVYIGDDAGNIHIALYLDAEASEQESESVGETETETNEETKEETKMNSTSKKTLDRTAAIKTIFYHLACGGYGDLPRATELYRYLSCDGEIGLTREGIKRYMLENALCDDDAFDYSNEEIADEWFRFADEDEDEEEAEDETTAKASGDLPKTIHFMDDIKGISEMSYQELEEYSESIIRGNIFYLECNGYFNGYGNEEMDYIDEYAIQAKAEWEKVKKQLRENPDLVLMIDKTNILYVPVVARKGGDDRNG